MQCVSKGYRRSVRHQYFDDSAEIIPARSDDFKGMGRHREVVTTVLALKLSGVERNLIDICLLFMKDTSSPSEVFLMKPLMEYLSIQQIEGPNRGFVQQVIDGEDCCLEEIDLHPTIALVMNKIHWHIPERQLLVITNKESSVQQLKDGFIQLVEAIGADYSPALTSQQLASVVSFDTVRGIEKHTNLATVKYIVILRSDNLQGHIALDKLLTTRVDSNCQVIAFYKSEPPSRLMDFMVKYTRFGGAAPQQLHKWSIFGSSCTTPRGVEHMVSRSNDYGWGGVMGVPEVRIKDIAGRFAFKVSCDLPVGVLIGIVPRGMSEVLFSHFSGYSALQGEIGVVYSTTPAIPHSVDAQGAMELCGQIITSADRAPVATNLPPLRAGNILEILIDYPSQHVMFRIEGTLVWSASMTFDCDLHPYVLLNAKGVFVEITDTPFGWRRRRISSMRAA